MCAGDSSTKLIRFERDGLRFTAFEFGDPEAEPIILLHGFPESAQDFHPLGEALAAAGCYVLIPEVRGREPLARPKGRLAYRLDEYAADVIALLSRRGLDSAHIVGHDLGGAVAWLVASSNPSRVRTMTSISMPHPRAYLASLLSSKQAFQSWYLLLMQLPFLPELLVMWTPALVEVILSRMGLDADLARKYLRRLKSFDSAVGAINWYRGLPLGRRSDVAGPISPPASLIWGSCDAVVSKRAAELTNEWSGASYTFTCLEGGSHWLVEQRLEEVTRSIVSIVGAHPNDVGATDARN